LRLKIISEDIQTYGTSSNLFDLTTRDRTTVKKVLYPLNEENETKNVKSEEIHLPFPMIHPKSKIKLLWTPIVVLLLIYTATFMPYALVFFDHDDSDWTNEWVILQLVVDILFWIDLLMNMLSAFYNEEGILVKSPKQIMESYFRGWFFIDLIACLPFNYIGDALMNDGTSAAGKLHLVRLSRIPRLYRLVKITKIAKVFRFLTNDSFVMEYFEFNSGNWLIFRGVFHEKMNGMVWGIDGNNLIFIDRYHEIDHAIILCLYSYSFNGLSLVL